MKYITHDLRNLTKELIIVPFGDVHFNTAACDRERFLSLISWLKARQRKGATVRLIGVGDYNDAFSPSERNVVQAGKGGYGLHDTTYDLLDEMAYSMSETFLEAISPLGKEAVITLLDGHHFMKFSSGKSVDYGKTTTQYMCRVLGCPYGSNPCHVSVRLPHNLTFTLLAAHGYGSARTDGARLAKRMRMSQVFPDCDAYLMGHDNTKSINCKRVLDPGKDGQAKEGKKVFYIATGSFQRSYMDDGAGNFIEELLLEPHDLGAGMLWINVEERNGKWRLDVHASV